MKLIFMPSRVLGVLWKIRRDDVLCNVETCGRPTTEGKLGDRAVLYCEHCKKVICWLKECAWHA
ncbi:MAG: hypothetical protein A2605_03320 [Candidatus Zambryskibacteria bacterium RIFOXYD1_FULL_39_35]|nr:MAG: hypothetical protein A2605_03320 [Candidatus Zambryskibacteria bacterium RIFOXYD1_FULL_39_35]